MRKRLLFAGILFACGFASLPCSGEEVLFEDTFDTQLSDRWEVVGLKPDDYRIRDGALEVRVKGWDAAGKRPLLQVKLPFTTAETVTASVEVTPVEGPLDRQEYAGLFLCDADGLSFSARKTNIDGYFVLA